MFWGAGYNLVLAIFHQMMPLQDPKKPNLPGQLARTTPVLQSTNLQADLCCALASRHGTGTSITACLQSLNRRYYASVPTTN
jgi:hypothetical protein